MAARGGSAERGSGWLAAGQCMNVYDPAMATGAKRLSNTGRRRSLAEEGRKNCAFRASAPCRARAAALDTACRAQLPCPNKPGVGAATKG